MENENNKIGELRKEILEYRQTNPRKTVSLCQQLILLGNELHEEEAAAFGEYYLGEAYFKSGQIENIMEHAAKALRYYGGSSNPMMEARIYNCLGVACSSKREYQMAVKYYLEALDITKKSDLKQLEVSVKNNLGVIYLEFGEFDQALTHFQENYVYYLENPGDSDFRDFWVVLSNKADVYCQMRQYDHAISCMEELDRRAETYEQMEILQNDLLHSTLLAKIYYGKQKKELGQYYVDHVFALASQGVCSSEAYEDYDQLADILIREGDRERAETIIDLLFQTAQCMDSINLSVRAVERIVQYYRWIGDNTHLLSVYEMYYELSVQRERELSRERAEGIKTQISMKEVEEKRQREAEEKEQMRLLSEQDSLTGFLNRYSLNKLCQKYYEKMKKELKNYGFIFVDVDFFKQYNDTYGHLAGDSCLRKIAGILQRHIDKDVLLARYGGDEFFAIVLNKEENFIRELIHSWIKGIYGENMIHEASFCSDRVSLTFGAVNMIPDDESTVLDMIQYADEALYHAKKRKKGTGSIYHGKDVYEVVE